MPPVRCGLGTRCIETFHTSVYMRRASATEVFGIFLVWCGEIVEGGDLLCCVERSANDSPSKRDRFVCIRLSLCRYPCRDRPGSTSSPRSSSGSSRVESSLFNKKYDLE